jgi:hypothetical protein
MANMTDKQANQLINLIRGESIQEFGKSGAKLINDTSTSAHTEGFYAIQGISSCTLDFTSGASTQSKVGGRMVDFDANFTIPNGAIIYGDFTKITLAGGSCIAYKKV